MIEMMSPSSTLANRSFLYGGNTSSNGIEKHNNGNNISERQSKSCLISDKIVYATLDSLALRRATLPLRLLPIDVNNDHHHHQTQKDAAIKAKAELLSKSIPDILPSSGNDEDLATKSPSTDSIELDAISDYIVIPAENSSESLDNGTIEILNDSSDKSNNNNESIAGNNVNKKLKNKQQNQRYTKKETNNVSNDKKKDKREFTFAKNVLHYVPMTSRRYYRKSRKLASKSLSLKSLGVPMDKSNNEDDNIFTSRRSLKSRSLSRDELKYITISMPSNFVHVASATKSDLMKKAEKTQERNYIEHEGKYADLRGQKYAEIMTGSVKNETAGNESFLWKNAKSIKDDKEAKFETNDDSDYDDVGPPVVNFNVTEKSESSNEKNLENSIIDEQEQDDYDDIGPPTITLTSENSTIEKDLNYDDQVYDDVGPLCNSYEIPVRVTIEVEEKVELRDSSNKERNVDEDVYDDVGLPTIQSNQECHERVNSLYAGSSVSGSINIGYNHYDKESEWEDLDDAALYGISSGNKIGNEHCHSTSSTPSKKKLGGQRWSRKVRRQRSKASRKSSGRSTSRTRKQATLSTNDAATARDTRTYSDSSDDSNYETLETYEPDDFSSDSETETRNIPTLPVTPTLHLSLKEPPCRPVPPPPREASLGHTLGRRMKMLRRTWSITKGSLGRMRRRASTDCESTTATSTAVPAGTENNGVNDARKYFSFKKHFRKSQSTALSTFYLDKMTTDKDNNEDKKEKDEPIYSNSSWYQEAGLYRSEDKEYVDQNAVDHYSVLAEEPLYQFYAAAATRTAFESDSDGYEEVEELTPSAATTDLARPGHRTLWCQTPQVINSGLLQTLSMEERKIQEAKFEIITSEASYLNSLRVLENEFASNYELTHDILTSAERDKLFGAVPDVLVASERFLAELESIWREDPMLTGLPELLLKHGDRSCQIYVDYCSNQVSIDTTLKELKAKKGYKFLETISRIEMHPACHSLSLHSFLMLPMQRITRLPLLADAVLSKLSVEHSERLSWERVLTVLSQIVAKCNEGAKLAERRNEMDALARKLEYSPKVPPIALRDRELIRSGTVVHLSSKSETEYKLTFGKKFHKTPLMLMLLTDYLLVTKLKSNSNDEVYNVIDTCKRSLVALETVPEDSPLAGRHAMVLTLLENHTGRQVEYLLTCENDTEKERWLDAVSPPKPSCVGETLYESWDCPQVMALYSYTSRQPDELTLQPGDVINVLRKMNDGWLFGEKLLDGDQGWFPGNFTKEVASEHVRARNLRQRHRFLALSGTVLQRKTKQPLSLL